MSAVYCTCTPTPVEGSRCGALTHEHGCFGRQRAGCRCDPCQAGASAARSMLRGTNRERRKCYCKNPPTTFGDRGYRQHEHGCWGRYQSKVDACRCYRCRRAFLRHLKQLRNARPDWVAVDRLVSGVPYAAATRIEKAEAVKTLRAWRFSLDQIATRMNTTPRTVSRICLDFNIPLPAPDSDAA